MTSLEQTHDRAVQLREEVRELAEWIYNGNLDDAEKITEEIMRTMEKALALGYDIGRAEQPVTSSRFSGEPVKADELVIFDFIRDKVYTRVEFAPSFEPTEVEMKIEITDDMVKRLIAAMRERPDGAMSDWLDHAINGGS